MEVNIEAETEERISLVRRLSSWLSIDTTSSLIDLEAYFLPGRRSD